MASIYKKGNIFWIQYYRNGERRQESLGTKSRKIAKYLCSKKETEIVVTPNIPDGNVDIKQALDKYIELMCHHNTPKTLYNDKIRISEYIKYLNARFINELTTNNFKEYLHYRLSHGIVPNTANSIINNVRKFLNWCVEQNYIAINPLYKYKLYKIERKSRRFLTKKEINAIMKVAKTSKLFGMIATAFYTGMRKGELLRLKWSDIDYATNLVTVHISKSKRCRHIPLSSKLKSILKALQPKSVLLKDDLCFNRCNERRLLKAVITKSKVNKFGWHTFRHTFASHLVQAGVSIYKVANYLSHSAISTTEIYAHLQPHSDKEINKI